MIDDAVYFVIMFFVVGISLVLVSIVMGGINNAVQDAPQMPNISKETMQSQTTSFNTVWDYTTLIVFFAIVAGLLGLAWILPTNPIVVFAMVIIIGGIGAVTGYLANAWIDMTSGVDAFSSASANFPVLNFIISNYLVFVVAVLFLVLIVFYAKPNPEGAF